MLIRVRLTAALDECVIADALVEPEVKFWAYHRPLGNDFLVTAE
jgi:hypothetical protein